MKKLILYTLAMSAFSVAQANAGEALFDTHSAVEITNVPTIKVAVASRIGIDDIESLNTCNAQLDSAKEKLDSTEVVILKVTTCSYYSDTRFFSGSINFIK